MRGETPTIPPLFQNCKWCTFIRGGLSNALSQGRWGEHGHSANSGLFQLGWGVGAAEGKERL